MRLGWAIAAAVALCPVTAGAQLMATQRSLTTSTQPQTHDTAGRIWYMSDGASQITGWLGLETARGVYNPANMASLYAVVDGLVAQGITNIIYTYGAVPSWANGGQTKDIPPTNSQDLFDFAGYIAAHLHAHCPSCTFWHELWNEPNINGTGSFWTPGDDNNGLTVGNTMAGYIQPMSAAIRAADPTAKVLSPCPAGSSFPSWLSDFFARGLHVYVDAVAWHMYPWTSNWGLEPEQLVTANAAALRAMAAYGVNLPTWWTEGGNGHNATDQTSWTRWASTYQLWGSALGAAEATWYSWDGGTSWGQLWDGSTSGSELNQYGSPYVTTQTWLAGTTWTSPLARVVGTNGVRNPSATGAVAGTPGTLPTDWTSYTPDSTHGITTQIVRTGAGYIDWRVYGTPDGAAAGYELLFFENNTGIAALPGQMWTAGVGVQVVGGSTAGISYQMGMYWQNSGGSNFGNLQAVLPPIYSTIAAASQIQSISLPGAPANTAYGKPAFGVYYTPGGGAVDITLRFTGPYADHSTIYSGTLTRSGGYQAQIVWDAAGGPTSYSTSYGWQRTVYGDVNAVSGGTVSLTSIPLILENAQWKGSLW